MKSKIVEEPMYPCLKIHEDTDKELVVLFYSPNCGVVVFDEEHERLGEHCENWKENEFDFYSGKVELTN